jgi:hypothetical protein
LAIWERSSETFTTTPRKQDGLAALLTTDAVEIASAGFVSAKPMSMFNGLGSSVIHDDCQQPWSAVCGSGLAPMAS